MRAISEAYWMAKEAKKYIPKNRRNQDIEEQQKENEMANFNRERAARTVNRYESRNPQKSPLR